MLGVIRLLPAVLLAISPVRGEVIEEIVAWINDEIITRSELQAAEQQVVEELYSKHVGEGLDKHLEAARSELLRDMITKRMLVQQAERLYDISKMQDAFVRQFKDQQKIATTPELERILKEEGLTLDQFRKRLVEINAPGSVVDYEVRDKISVSDAEIDKYYKERGAELANPDRITFREILFPIESRSVEETVGIARAIAERARSGDDFVDLAKQNSQVAPDLRGGVLGPFTKGELAPEMEKAVFSMREGEVSDPIVAGQVVHVVRIEDREQSVMPALETVREKISATIEREKFSTAMHSYIEGLWQRSEVRVADEYMARIPTELRKYVK